MAVISFPQGEPWVVGGPAFRLVLDPVIAALSDGDDRDEVEVAFVSKALMLELMPEDRALRIAALLEREAAELRRRLLANSGADNWDLELAGYLETLGLLLDDFLGYGDE